MSGIEDEWALLRLERELEGDDGVRDALVAFDERSGRSPRRCRRYVVTVLGIITAVAILASGTAASVLGVMVLVIAALAVFDAHRNPRRRRASIS
jgi:hypothetical protein